MFLMLKTSKLGDFLFRVLANLVIVNVVFETFVKMAMAIYCLLLLSLFRLTVSRVLSVIDVRQELPLDPYFDVKNV